MTGNEIREKFLKYFADKEHRVVESSPLVPQDDPTLLFTNAGMVQFKRLFTGEDKADYVRATSCQRCVRAGGKHNDLDNVGYTARHHTFFEMLGNFSFGDYFKEDAIFYGWDFLTRVIGLPPEKMWVSVFEEDDEAFAMWEKIEDLPKGRIVRLGAEDNFWAMGDTGPCGPCSEIHIDQGPEVECDRPDCAVGCDCDRYLELWNLVFMQFERSADGTMTPLPKPSIDTGMGLERVAAVVQGGYSNYDSDLFSGLIARIGKIAGIKYGDTNQTDTAMRVIADHCRATTFLVADGVLPSNEGRGYVLRRIIRRAVRYGGVLGLNKPFMAQVADYVVEDMSHAYPHLPSAAELLRKVVTNEEERFLETLGHGLEILENEIARLKKSNQMIIAGDFVFKLYDTFGFPIDIVRDMAIEQDVTVDEAGFNQAMDQQRSQSRKSWKGGSLDKIGQGIRSLKEEQCQTEFAGYETLSGHSMIHAIVGVDGQLVDLLEEGQSGILVIEKSPFYAESGGQIGDHGECISKTGRAAVVDTVSLGDGVFGHKVESVTGTMTTGAEVDLQVDEERRRAIASNHTATHLLQAVLVEILGDHVKQSGSLVESDRLRFDFTHFSPLTPEEVQRVEERVNEEIRNNKPLATDHLSKEEAIAGGATALFGEKYAETVRVVSIDSLSKELCGGTHVTATGEIGLFQILSETGIAAGVRRIEAVTGASALARTRESQKKLDKVCNLLRSTPELLGNKVEDILVRLKEMEKEIGRLNAKLSVVDLDALINQSQEIDGVKVVVSEISLDSAKTMREVGDKVREKLASGVAVLAGKLKGKVSLLVIVSADLTGKLHAGKIIKDIAAVVGGSGGGRVDMAQAGGTMADKLPEALKKAIEVVERELAS
jgi:alanyl-tRNA synthetase